MKSNVSYFRQMSGRRTIVALSNCSNCHAKNKIMLTTSSDRLLIGLIVKICKCVFTIYPFLFPFEFIIELHIIMLYYIE